MAIAPSVELMMQNVNNLILVIRPTALYNNLEHLRLLQQLVDMN